MPKNINNDIRIMTNVMKKNAVLGGLVGTNKNESNL